MITRRQTFIALAGLVLWAGLALLILMQALGLKFHTQFNVFYSALSLYHHRIWPLLIVISIVIGFYGIVGLRIRALPYSFKLRAVIALPPLLLLSSLTYLTIYGIQFWQALNVPLDQGLFAMRRFAKNFSAKDIDAALATLPHHIDTLIYPSYAALAFLVLTALLLLILPRHHD